MHTPTTQDMSAFVRWTTALDYKTIRHNESVQHARFENGKYVRGICITDTICIARDGQFYDLSGPTAQLITPWQVLERHTLDEVRSLFASAVARARRRHHTRHAS